jgi:hypothetical protein
MKAGLFWSVSKLASAARLPKTTNHGAARPSALERRFGRRCEARTDRRLTSGAEHLGERPSRRESDDRFTDASGTDVDADP